MFFGVAREAHADGALRDGKGRSRISLRASGLQRSRVGKGARTSCHQLPRCCDRAPCPRVFFLARRPRGHGAHPDASSAEAPNIARLCPPYGTVARYSVRLSVTGLEAVGAEAAWRPDLP